MSISVADNFKYQGTKPLDDRIKYATVADMKAVADAKLYDGCEAYCAETDKYYKFKSTNTVDETTGKWRERESGGSGGGHIIEDSEGTDLSQRDTLQFGDGFAVSDDSTHEKTVVELDQLSSGEMADIVTPLPSVQPNLPILYDDSETERVVGYALVNGVKKKVYECEHIETIVALPNTWVETTMPVGDIDRVLSITAFSNKNALNCFICSCAVNTKIQVNCFRNVNGGSTEINGFTLRYLKTTG